MTATAALLARAVALIAVGFALIAVGLASLSASPAKEPEPRWMRPATLAEEREWQIQRLVDEARSK
ncbi:hypothetical protein [Salinispora tropica]|uniref:hypothetical protein n=1 Tax=Salinispora tropica TaxID=168695 RepID=UPI000319012B|nr:hypothetical protein [Salinispora tropica]